MSQKKCPKHINSHNKPAPLGNRSPASPSTVVWDPLL